MPTLSVESNGRLEKTAIYYNGQQVSGVKELMINLDEDGTFDALIQYQGTDGQIHNKQIFADYLTSIKTVEPSFTEEDANELQLLTVESDGDIDSCGVFINEEMVDGIISLYVHIQAGQNSESKSSLLSLFKPKKVVNMVGSSFKSEITFRNEDNSTETEEIF
jgi:hypothetical protein